MVIQGTSHPSKRPHGGQVFRAGKLVDKIHETIDKLLPPLVTVPNHHMTVLATKGLKAHALLLYIPQNWELNRLEIATKECFSV